MTGGSRLPNYDFFEEFCREFAKEMNRLRMEQRAGVTAAKRELERVKREIPKVKTYPVSRRARARRPGVQQSRSEAATSARAASNGQGRTIVRRSVILALVLVVLVGAAAGWRWWAAGAITLPGLPPNPYSQFALSPHGAESQRPCPEEPVTIHVSWMGPPDSPRKTVATVDGVVVARMEQAPLDVIEIVHCLFVTLYPFTIEQSIKGPLRPGDAVQIRWGGRPIDTVAHLPRPRVRERFLFLLKNAESGPGYHLAYGPSAHYRIVDGRLAPLEPGGSGDAAGRRLEGFVAELRRMVGQD